MAKGPLVSRSILCLLLAGLIAPAPVAAQRGSFSLDFHLRDAAGDRVISDRGPYADLSDPGGRAPDVYAIDGNIAVGLDRSIRRICLNFAPIDDGDPLTDDDPLISATGRPLPSSGCYPGKVHVRFGITDLTPTDEPLLLSFVVYWTGPGSDGRVYDYSLGFRPRHDNGVLATAINSDTWKVEQTITMGHVEMFLSGKNGGWQTVADYDMPFGATAYRLIPNLRT